MQEQNEDFLDGKFNDDQLNSFSENKFIKCKSSVDFYIEQCVSSNLHLFSEPEKPAVELFINDHCLGTESDKQLVERSSEDEPVIESRKRHFLEFMYTIPKVCTSSACGIMQSSGERSPSSSHRQQNILINLNQLTEVNEEILFEEDEHELVMFTQKDYQSNGVHQLINRSSGCAQSGEDQHQRCSTNTDIRSESRQQRTKGVLVSSAV